MTLKCLMLIMAASTVLGPTWIEDGDAGSLPGDAQITEVQSGEGLVTKIEGELEGNVSATAGFDLEDMYVIRVCDPASFIASTRIADGGGADFDTQLWLFEPDPFPDAFGLLANNNVTAMNTRSRIVPASNDGSGAMLTDAGRYLIAVSGFNRRPQDGQGDDLFLFATGVEISGPDGEGGANEIAGWAAPSVPAVGIYTIALDGVVAGETTGIDCNSNGRADACDIYYYESSLDVNGDGIPDECQCLGDVNGDSTVGVDDVLAIIGAWGALGGPADVNADGIVNTDDLLLVLGSWGPC